MPHFPSTNERQCPTIAVCCARVSFFTFSHLFLPAGWMSSEGEMSENLHFNICLKSAHGVSHVAINSRHTPLQYTAPDQTSAEVRPCQTTKSQRQTHLCPISNCPIFSCTGVSVFLLTDVTASTFPRPWSWRQKVKALQPADAPWDSSILLFGSLSSPHPACPQVSLKSSPSMYGDLNVLVYYRGPHTLSAVVERRDPKAPPGE